MLKSKLIQIIKEEITQILRESKGYLSLEIYPKAATKLFKYVPLLKKMKDFGNNEIGNYDSDDFLETLDDKIYVGLDKYLKSQKIEVLNFPPDLRTEDDIAIEISDATPEQEKALLKLGFKRK